MMVNFMITGRQIRAARALLEWDAEDLADKAGLSRDTIFNIEKGIVQARETTIDRIVQAFASHDIEFLPDEGVKVRRSDLVKYNGVEGFKRFMDDIYEVARRSTPAEQEAYPIYCSNVDDTLYIKHLGDFFVEHIRRMTALKLKTRVHILIKNQPYSYRAEEIDWGYRQYRRYPENIKMVGDTVFYAYGRKLAILMLSGRGAPQVIIIDSPLAAKAYREQFELTWQMAVPLDQAELNALAKQNKEDQGQSYKGSE